MSVFGVYGSDADMVLTESGLIFPYGSLSPLKKVWPDGLYGIKKLYFLNYIVYYPSSSHDEYLLYIRRPATPIMTTAIITNIIVMPPRSGIRPFETSA